MPTFDRQPHQSTSTRYSSGRGGTFDQGVDLRNVDRSTYGDLHERSLEPAKYNFEDLRNGGYNPRYHQYDGRPSLDSMLHGAPISGAGMKPQLLDNNKLDQVMNPAKHGVSGLQSNPNIPAQRMYLNSQQNQQLFAKQQHQVPVNSLMNVGMGHLSNNTMMLGSYNRQLPVNELVQVPEELAAFAAEAQFQQILLRVKDQSGATFISVNRISDASVESITVEAPSRESAQLARSLIETHLKQQMRIKAAETRLHKVQNDLFSTQGEISSGHVTQFSVRADLVGLAIGKKGARIRSIEADTGVSSINVGENGHIVIYGNDAQSVLKAREQLELLEESNSLSQPQIEWFANKTNSTMLSKFKPYSTKENKH